MRGSELAAALSVSVRTVQLEIARINEHSDLPAIESNRRLGYRLHNADLQRVSIDQAHAGELLGEPLAYLFECQIIMVLLFERGWVSLAEVARRLNVARSTVVASLPRVRRIIPRTPGARFVAQTGHGVRIEVHEHAARAMLMKILGMRFDAELFYGIGHFDGIQRDVEDLQSALAELPLRAQVPYTGVAFASLASYIAISILRSCFGFALSGTEVYPDSPFVAEIAKTVELWCGYRLSAPECAQVLELLNGSSVISAERIDAPASPWARAATVRFEEAARTGCGVDFGLDEEARTAFARHLDRLRVRLDAGMVNVGRETNELFGRYPLAVHVLRTCLDPVFGTRIPDAELGYMVPYLTEAIEGRRKPLQVALVSDRSAGSILRLRRALAAAAGTDRVEVTCLPGYALARALPAQQTGAAGPCLPDSAAPDAAFTTEPRLALLHPQMMLVSPERPEETVASLQERMQAVRETVRARRQEKMAQRFPMGSFDRAPGDAFAGACACEDRAELARRLGSYVAVRPQDISLEPLDPARLCIIAHAPADAGTSMVTRGACAPFQYRGKAINELVVVVFARDVDVVEFFIYVRTLLA